jgi:hypothetical protein
MYLPKPLYSKLPSLYASGGVLCLLTLQTSAWSLASAGLLIGAGALTTLWRRRHRWRPAKPAVRYARPARPPVSAEHRTMNRHELLRTYRRLCVQLEASRAMPAGNDNRISDITEQMTQVARALALHGRLVEALSDLGSGAAGDVTRRGR